MDWSLQRWDLLYADPYIQHMLQRVFPHDLFQGERVGAGMIEFRQVLDLDAVLIDIVHARARPALFVVGKGEVIAFAAAGGVPRLPDRTPDPDIVIVVRVRMPQHQVDIIAIDRVLRADVKADRRPEIAFPLLTGKRYVLFKDIRGRVQAGPMKQQAISRIEIGFSMRNIYIKVKRISCTL
jgi:hypothetical protein